MASLFSSFVLCEGDNCKEIADVTYYVKEKKFCKDCASKEGCTVKASTGEQSLVCEEHDEQIKQYCKTHGVPLCNTWAMEHHDKYCVLQDIADAIEEIKVKLKGLKGKAKKKQKSCHAYGVKILQCRKESDAHLQAIKDEIDKAIQKVIKIDEDREREDAAIINQEIDEKNGILQEKIETLQEKIETLQEKTETLQEDQEEIDMMKYDILENNEEREKKLAMNHTNAEIRRQPLKKKQYDLLMHIQRIAEEVEKKIGELEKFLNNNMKATEDAIQTLDTVLEDDKNVVKDGHRVNTSVADELKKPLDESWVTHITQTVSGVRFVKGVGGKKYNGRIDGFEWQWKLSDTIYVPDEINYPVIVGCIDESNVIISDDGMGALHTYVLDMNTERTQKVITGSSTSFVTSCALLNDSKIVCGKSRLGRAGESLTGCISVYDRQWKLINDVTIPRNTTNFKTWVNVAADQHGMIIAAEVGQSKIYVINPADGKIIHTIDCKEEICNMLEGRSTDQIIIRPNPQYRKVLIVDKDGSQREIAISTSDKHDVILNVCIDPLMDDLYVVTSDYHTKEYVIDQVMSGGDITKRRVAVFPPSNKQRIVRCGSSSEKDSIVVMTSLGKIIVFDGNNILVYKKIFNL